MAVDWYNETVRSRAKWVWRLFIFAVAFAAYFGVLPKDWGATMDLIISLDTWIINHAAYPGIFLISIALVIGTIVVPDVWNWIYRTYLFEPQPNMLLRNALTYINDKTQWAYINRHTAFLRMAAAHKWMERAGRGDIKVWGTPHEGFGGRSLHFTRVEYEIEKTHWSKHELDLDVIFDPSKDGFAQTRPINRDDEAAKAELEYARIRVDRRELRRQRDWKPIRPWQQMRWRIERWREGNT